MPHDTHTTHEPDRVGREGDETANDRDISRQTTLLMFGAFAPPERDPAPLIV